MFVFVCVCFEGDVSRKTGFSLLSLEIKDSLLNCITSRHALTLNQKQSSKHML